MQRAVFIAAALVQAGAAEDPWAADALGLVAGVPVVDWRAPHRFAAVRAHERATDVSKLFKDAVVLRHLFRDLSVWRRARASGVARERCFHRGRRQVRDRGRATRPRGRGDT